MAEWNKNPNWVSTEDINEGQRFEGGDGVIAEDINKIIENMLYLYQLHLNYTDVRVGKVVVRTSNTVNVQVTSRTEGTITYLDFVFDLTQGDISYNNPDFVDAMNGTFAVGLSTGENIYLSPSEQITLVDAIAQNQILYPPADWTNITIASIYELEDYFDQISGSLQVHTIYIKPIPDKVYGKIFYLADDVVRDLVVNILIDEPCVAMFVWQSKQGIGDTPVISINTDKVVPINISSASIWGYSFLNPINYNKIEYEYNGSITAVCKGQICYISDGSEM